MEFAKSVLVSTEWVAEHRTDPGIKLVEVDVDVNAYDAGHIEGSIGWKWTTQLQDTVRRDILSPEQMQELLRASGIGNDDTIILYGDNNNWFAAYAYWQLSLYGHPSLKMMDGGSRKWAEENRPLTKEPTQPKRSGYVVKGRDDRFRALQPEVLSRIGKAGSAMIDVRSPQEFTGEVLAPPGLTETAQRGGHIPGAANVPWSKAVREDGTFKSADELKALYEGAGAEKDKDIVTYCRIGERSSHTWFVLHELLGYPKVKNYDGSWTEWGSMVATPIER